MRIGIGLGYNPAISVADFETKRRPPPAIAYEGEAELVLHPKENNNQTYSLHDNIHRHLV